MKGPPGARFNHTHHQHQADIAARGEAKRRQDDRYAKMGGPSPTERRHEFIKNTIGLIFGSVAIGIVLLMAWNSGLIG